MTGTYIRYSDVSFRREKRELVELCAQISDEYEEKGYVLSVRQVFYMLVSDHGYPNRAGAYDRVQEAISDGRMAGIISWTAFEDRGRGLRGLRTQTCPEAALRATRAAYRRDLWATQPMRPEVWIEKQALEGVVSRICNRLRVDFYATKGYNSQSSQWEAGQRFAARVADGQRPLVIHLGDHDPSGLDMTRDNHVRLTQFAGFPVPVERVALNMNQVEEYRLPHNPDNRPKRGDPRTADYLERHGDMGWEMDALGPERLERIIEDAVLRVRDQALWDAALAEEVSDLRVLDEMLVTMGGNEPEDEEDDE